MARRLAELAKTIDDTLLDPAAPAEVLRRLCDEAREHHFASVCVLPGAVAAAAERLRGCDVKVAVVIGFPDGAGEARAKAEAAERCVAEGADELDVVVNVRAMLGGQFRLARDELAAVVHSVGMRSVNTGRGGPLVKVVLECARLGTKRVQLACRIVEDVGADFVSTATGDGRERPSLADVELLRDRLPERIGLKAAGAIATRDEASELVTAGAVRLGTRHAVAVVDPETAARRAVPA